MEQSLQRLETDLQETKRERDKARQELKRLKQHLLEKVASGSCICKLSLFSSNTPKICYDFNLNKVLLYVS